MKWLSNNHIFTESANKTIGNKGALSNWKKKKKYQNVISMAFWIYCLQIESYGHAVSPSLLVQTCRQWKLERNEKFLLVGSLHSLAYPRIYSNFFECSS